ncbi:MAG: triphosphoribosyl-dephospho-CoA synthase [Hyphomicrobiales bacterium]
MIPLESAIGVAFEQACREELETPKPGNVHVFAAGRDATAQDFLVSARVAAPFIVRQGARIGERILGAVEATLEAVGTNTNLGIILLCAPLAAASERGAPDLRAGIHDVLAELDRADASLAFQAIRRAAPGGLGEVPKHDVRSPPEVSLREAMVEAAPRDRIARQYATDFSDMFETGLPALQSSLKRGTDSKVTTLEVYLTFLSNYPDTHIVRKRGAAVAADIMPTARAFLGRLREGNSLADLQPDLLAWDAALKSAGINPGTSADLTVATLFAFALQSILRPTDNSD